MSGRCRWDVEPVAATAQSTMFARRQGPDWMPSNCAEPIVAIERLRGASASAAASVSDRHLLSAGELRSAPVLPPLESGANDLSQLLEIQFVGQAIAQVHPRPAAVALVETPDGQFL